MTGDTFTRRYFKASIVISGDLSDEQVAWLGRALRFKAITIGADIKGGFAECDSTGKPLNPAADAGHESTELIP